MKFGAMHEGAASIRDYAIVGNARTAALISQHGSLDWLCWPRFDSPAAFCRLLDDGAGGRFSICPRDDFQSRRHYVAGSAVLVTTFTTLTGMVSVSDYFPLGEACDERPQTLIRRVDGLAGHVDLTVRFFATFDFAQGTTEHRATADGLLACKESLSLRLDGLTGFRPHPAGGMQADLVVRAGETSCLVLGAVIDNDARARTSSQSELEETVRNWRTWSNRIEYSGPYQEAVTQSAITLKLLTYEPTGAMVAAPTTSLPEQLGGTRNWDYRFTWLRDAALTLRALLSLGLHDEAASFWQCFEGLPIDTGDSRKHADTVKTLYTIDGAETDSQRDVSHLVGYRGSAPVRVGNRAAGQQQLDIFGYVLDAAWSFQQEMNEEHPRLAPLLRYFADQAAERWRNPDKGIWEFRGEPRHFLNSKLSCWVALDRAIRVSERGWLEGDVATWTNERDAARTAILARGYDTELGTFVSAFGERSVDATALRISVLGLLPGNDPRMLSTISVLRRRLEINGLMRRYDWDDQLPGREGAFTLCSFWLVEALALAGETAEARRVFESVLAHANDVRLFSEEIDPVTGELLGNFPQAFTHFGLIEAALRLKQARD